VDFPKNWAPYTTPVSLSNSEYAFARCGRTRREGLLLNRFNPKIAEKANLTSQSLQKSLNLTSPIRPLAVYILMFDSVARMHFFRSFPETVKFLNQTMREGYLGKEFALYDFAINNAHGENTQPNMVPFLFGYDIKYHKERLYDFSIHHPADSWKYREIQQEVLWKHFENLGFVTYFGYDTVWDSFSHSFGRYIEADHMVSNFFHAAKKLAGYTDFLDKERCIGPQNAHNFALTYITQFHTNYKGLNRFGYQHLSTGHDKGGTVIKTADGDTKAFLEKLLTESLKNSNEDLVLFLASDHGKHSSEWDKTYEGFLENQLPLHLAIVSQGLLSRLQANNRLTHNSKRLVSRLDWHLTLQHLATVPYGRLDPSSPLYQAWKRRSDSPNAISLFLEDVPDDRDCEDLNIPLHYCSCKEFLEIPKTEAVKMPAIMTLAQLGVAYINAGIDRDEVGDICAHLTVLDVLKAGYQLSVRDLSSLSRSFKVRVSVKESENAKFDIVGMLVPAEDYRRRSQTAAAESTFVTDKGEELKVIITVTEVFRVDPYAGICEEMAIAAQTQAPFCICHLPFSVSPLTEFQVKVTEKILSRLELALAVKGRNCHFTCMDLGKGCHPWTMEIINDERVLLKAWRPEDQGYDYVEMGTKRKGKLGQLRVRGWTREGKIIKLRNTEGGWVGFLADPRKGASCDDQPKTDFAICPCY